VNYPGDLDGAVSDWLAQAGRGGLVEETAALRRAYRAGESSGGLDLAAYLVSRVPATFAANQRVQQALAEAWPDFEPHSLLDIGTGPGTASWAAVAQWDEFQSITQCEQDPRFATLATSLNAASGISVLQSAEVLRVSEVALAVAAPADMVVASYMLAELPLATMEAVAHRLWARSGQVLVLIEPGTPQGFERLRIVREVLLGQGAFVIAPCTHQSLCPMSDKNWCHFKTRVQRSRAHMHAKQGTVPFEDEAFSYLVLARQPVAQSGGRVVAPVAVNKVAATLALCDAAGLHDEVIASRDKPAYKRAKKTGWGDLWE
jgi:ribosomal protein RSM22 (predicted rRNA methylase)